MDELEQLKAAVEGMRALLNGPPFEERAVARIRPEDNGGLGVSTVQILDEPPWEYETAILDAEGAHPVERYRTAADSEAGHLRWVEASQNLVTVTQLGAWKGLVPDKEVCLKRVR
jgi:hypothetical protein